MEIWTTAAFGVAFLVAGWIVPIILPHPTHLLQVVLLAASGILFVAAIIMGIVSYKRKKQEALNATPSILADSPVSVTMGDHNTINQIGHTYDGRKKDS